MLDRCVRLIHATAGRRRYRIESATPIDWLCLEAELAHLRDSEALKIRLNRSCHSVVFQLNDGAAPHLLQEAWTRLCVAVERAGGTPLAPPVLYVRVKVVRPSPLEWIRRLAAPLNVASLCVALGLLLLALLLTVMGILGMLLPLTPGAPLLLLAWILLEAAFAMRRPFVGPVSAA